VVKALFIILSRLGKNSALGCARRERNFITVALLKAGTYLVFIACVSPNGLYFGYFEEKKLYIYIYKQR
jgi:hypothetical protein